VANLTGKYHDSPETVGDGTGYEFNIAFDSNDSEARFRVIVDGDADYVKLAGDPEDSFNIAGDLESKDAEGFPLMIVESGKN
jgi:hypothetical protein